jgi:hypothetical protein
VITNPKPFTAVEILLLCGIGVSLTVGFLVMRRRERSPSVLVASALLATVVVSLPFTASAVVKDVRKAHGYSAYDAARVGPESNGLDTSMIDRIAAIIPKHATYEILFSPRVDVSVAGVFRVWSLTNLLPRVAVDEDRDADWIVTVGARPSAFEVQVDSVRRVASERRYPLTAWVGRLR